MMRVSRNDVANAVGGLLAGYGFVAFFCFLLLVEWWAHVAPRIPDAAHGLVFAHNEHGSITYFSGFQGTSCAVLFATSIPLCFLGSFLAPKRNVVARRGFLSVSAKWDQDDPKRLFTRAIVLGSIGAPIAIFALGPGLIKWLNGVGFVTGF